MITMKQEQIKFQILWAMKQPSSWPCMWCQWVKEVVNCLAQYGWKLGIIGVVNMGPHEVTIIIIMVLLCLFVLISPSHEMRTMKTYHDI